MTAEFAAEAELPDVEGAVRSWLRTHPRLTMLGGRVFFGLPDSPSYPMVTVGRIGGAPRGALDYARLSLHAWGTTKSSAAGVATSLAAAVEALGMTALTAGVLAHGGTVDSYLWQPAAPDGFPRYVVDVTIIASTISV